MKRQKTYKSVVIIGNGFDLNLGLKTSYYDFILSKQFTSLLKGNYFAQYLKEKHTLRNWIDIENELKAYSTKSFEQNQSINFEKDFFALSRALKDYLLEISYSDLDKSMQAYKLIEYAKEKDFLILDFNYTRTVNVILAELGVEKETIKERVIKVHGSIDEEELIFGVEDNANINEDHIFLKKAYYKSFKAINIKEILDGIDNLFLFGHSLGKTDHTYFRDFFSNVASQYGKNRKKMLLFYYKKEGYKRLFKELDKLTHNNLTSLRQNNNIEFIDTNE